MRRGSRKNRARADPQVFNIIMLNSAEHEILNACKYKSFDKFGFFRLS